MNEQERNRVVSDETAKEDEYNKLLKEKRIEARKYARVNNPNSFTNPEREEFHEESELVGRISIDPATDPFEEGLSDFYIGEKKLESDRYRVVNWTTAIASACLYGKPVEIDAVADVVVRGRRTFAHSKGKITDFQDEPLDGSTSEELFPRQTLQVPKAPTFSPVIPATSPEEEPQPEPQESIPAPSAEIHKPPITIPGPPLRAAELLKRQLAKPKSSTMSAVLSTLQRDQYEAITRPAMESQILQGHPGTGKTIIAAHRAAYLLSEDASPEGPLVRGQVLVLGPTTEYVEYIRSAVGKLIGDLNNVEVLSMPTLLEQLIRIPQSTVPTQASSYQDVDKGLVDLVDIAYTRSRKNSEPGEVIDRETIYSELIWLLEEPPDGDLQPKWEWGPYLRGLPKTYKEFLEKREYRHRGLMAYISVRAERRNPSPAHIIVDEAQDIHPIEWAVLGRLGNSGGWTILGDLNQRRTDDSFNSWDEVADMLAIEDEDGRAPVHKLELGYRSTAQIMRFANQLLPKEERVLYSLQQEGEKPKITRISTATNLPEATISGAEDLCKRVGEGTVAIITVDTELIRRALLRRGWAVEPGDVTTLNRDDLTVRLLPPERARGLEFDGVVVVEPAEFPENVGRLGVLYTALTRANQLLTVVYHRALPKGLKAT
ncbi:MAG: AAA family ATPase [Microbacteriaceae bacterium]|nr:AAA family ATPase [Microbacteriaceae bacterium]